MLQDTLKPVRFDPKSQQYKLAVMRFYGFLTGKLALTKNVVKCISYTPGIYTVASATDVWTDHKVVHMHRLADCWACDCEATSLCWHIAGACATHYYTNETYNPIKYLHTMLVDRNDRRNKSWPICQAPDCLHVEFFPCAGFCQVHFDDAQALAKAQAETPHDPNSDHTADCKGCLQAAGNPDTSHWTKVSSDFWACRKMWGLGACGGRAVSIGGYCATCAANGWDDRLAGR